MVTANADGPKNTAQLQLEPNRPMARLGKSTIIHFFEPRIVNVRVINSKHKTPEHILYLRTLWFKRIDGG